MITHRRHRLLRFVASYQFGLYGMLLIVLGTACSHRNSAGPSSSSGNRRDQLVGRWRRVTSAACAELYPAEIEFFESTFLAHKGPQQRFITWDAGSYRINPDGTATLSTATDELIAYTMRLAKTQVHFVAPDGCTFTYERI
ncbi:MAG: hypothetical protein SH847_15590 [Roseiflexaceae bacterium]|nr:hypothetical protein [Roseiflexaceae bacterium]